MSIVLAVVIGLVFGFALNRVGATNPNLIINMLRLRDLHLMKTILFAIGFSSLVLFLGMAVGVLDAGHLSIKASSLGVVLGGALLGIGFAIAGYCPGTGLAAGATGRRDAWWFVGGGLLGAFAFMLSYPAIKATGVLTDVLGGKSTLAQTGTEYTALVTTVPGPVVAGGLAILFMGLATILPQRLR